MGEKWAIFYFKLNNFKRKFLQEGLLFFSESKSTMSEVYLGINNSAEASVANNENLVKLKFDHFKNN
jgi:hypothetical protein